MKNYNFEFQKKFAAVFLPLTQSLCFFNTNFKNSSDQYVVWLEQNVANELCRNKFDEINCHYEYNHDSSIWRAHAPPSERLNLPFVSYNNGELDFNNGRHRTRTLIDYGAEFIPFDIGKKSLESMVKSGVKIVFNETTLAFSKSIASMASYSRREIDPVINSSTMTSIQQINMDEVIKTTQIYLKLLKFDIQATEQLKRIYVDFKPDELTDKMKQRIKIHDRFLWYRDALSIALPAFSSLKRQGIMHWPNGSCFPAYIGSAPNGMSPEEAVKDWAHKLQVPVRLGHPVRESRPSEKDLI